MVFLLCALLGCVCAVALVVSAIRENGSSDDGLDPSDDAALEESKGDCTGAPLRPETRKGTVTPFRLKGWDTDTFI
jgi:hypothetical protein